MISIICYKFVNQPPIVRIFSCVYADDPNNKKFLISPGHSRTKEVIFHLPWEKGRKNKDEEVG